MTVDRTRRMRARGARTLLATALATLLAGCGDYSGGDRQLPPTFDLTLESGETYRCRLCWKLRDKIGVEFLELYE